MIKMEQPELFQAYFWGYFTVFLVQCPVRFLLHFFVKKLTPHQVKYLKSSSGVILCNITLSVF